MPRLHLLTPLPLSLPPHRLNSANLDRVVKIIQENMPNVGNDDNPEIEIAINSLDRVTLWALKGEDARLEHSTGCARRTAHALPSHSHPPLCSPATAFVDSCKAKLVGFEVPKKIGLVSELWTPDNDLLTATMKLKRQPIIKKHQALIDKLYA